MLPCYSVVSLCVLLLVNLTGFAVPWALSAESSPAQESEKVRVTCPAIEIDESQRPINGPDISPCPIQLVVLGTAKRDEKYESGDVVYELKVEKVLYGSTAEKTMRFHEHFYISGPERQIFALVPQAYGGPADYELKYHVDVKEEESQMAMSAARLDYHALAADSVFIGKEIAVNAADDQKHTIEVVRLIHGSEPKVGEKSIMEIKDHVRTQGKVAEIRPEPMLYFLDIESNFLHRKVYRVDTRLPAACETDVVAALKRRDLYPIVDTTEWSKKLRGREVTFRGSVDEAIDFLGSERYGSVNLAVRAIMCQKDAAREKLAAAIQRELFRQAEPAPGEFRKLHNLIRLLGRLGGGSSGDPLAGLLKKELDYVESQPAETPTPKNQSEAGYRNEADDDDANHALVWLAVAIDEQVLFQRYGNRLMKLRDAAKGHWKAELQLALDVAHVEDNLELAALAQREQTNYLRSQPRIYHPQGVQAIAFSRDSKFLATGGAWGDIRVWNTEDWTCAQMIELDGQIYRLSFSPDGKFLSATSADGIDLDEHRFEWRTGIGVAQPEGRGKETKSLQPRFIELLTPDGKHRVTASENYSNEHFIQLRVTGADQVPADIRIPRVWDDTFTLAISPDSGQVAIGSGDVRLGIYSLPDLKTIKEYQFSCLARREERVLELVYSPDGKWLAAAQERRPTPRLFRADTGEEVMPYEGHGHYAIDLRFLPDGKTLRSIGEDATVCTWDADTLKMLRRSSLPAGRLAASVRPSDGLFALCPFPSDPKKPIQVIDVETGKALCEVALPLTWGDFGVTEHIAAVVRRVHWLNDQEILCTGYFIKSDSGEEDHWWRFNYRTGQVLKEGPIDINTQNSFLNGLGELTEDGRRLLVIDDAGKGTWGPLKSEWIDTATLASQNSGETKIDRQPNGDFGLVPGGKYFHIGSHVFDRQTIKLVAARDFPRDRLSKIAFSADGSRYAAVIEKISGINPWPGIDEWSWYRKYPMIVRIHETLTGKTLLAFSPSATVWRLAFSADGQRVATANDDGTIEVRDVPSAAVR
ncbi:MAG: WD40 repeat domain-containing protein [Thermoguttaceae bacterium]|jgi:WD40 repeat protein